MKKNTFDTASAKRDYNVSPDNSIFYAIILYIRLDGHTLYALNNLAFNPCPSGWRVPTQDEWERVANYDCNPTVSSSFSSTAVGTDTKGFAWIPVLCNSGQCLPHNGTSTPGWIASGMNNKTGYAVYKYSDWSTYVGGDLLTFDKEPLLFLPATGSRNSASGAVNAVGMYGDYWSSTPFGTFGRALRFNSNNVYPNSNGDSRALACSVRCVAE